MWSYDDIDNNNNKNNNNMISFFQSVLIAFQFSGSCSSEVTKCLAVGRRKLELFKFVVDEKCPAKNIGFNFSWSYAIHFFNLWRRPSLSGKLFFSRGCAQLLVFLFRLIPIPNQLVCVCQYCRAMSCVVHRDPTLRLDLDLVTRQGPCCDVKRVISKCYFCIFKVINDTS